jgi:hypothetical protein
MAVMQAHYTAVFQRDGDWWMAWAEELPGANTQGARACVSIVSGIFRASRL